MKLLLGIFIGSLIEVIGYYSGVVGFLLGFFGMIGLWGYIGPLAFPVFIGCSFLGYAVQQLCESPDWQDWVKEMRRRYATTSGLRAPRNGAPPPPIPDWMIPGPSSYTSSRRRRLSGPKAPSPDHEEA